MLNSWFESLASSGTTLAELGDAAFIIQQRDSFHRIIYIKADSDNMARFLVDWGMLWEKDGKDASSKLNLVISYFCDCFFSMWRKVLNYTKAGVIVQPWSNFRGLGLPELKLKEAVVKEFSQNGCRELTVEEITTLIQALLFKQSYG